MTDQAADLVCRSSWQYARMTASVLSPLKTYSLASNNKTKNTATSTRAKIPSRSPSTPKVHKGWCGGRSGPAGPVLARVHVSRRDPQPIHSVSLLRDRPTSTEMRLGLRGPHSDTARWRHEQKRITRALLACLLTD